MPCINWSRLTMQTNSSYPYLHTTGKTERKYCTAENCRLPCLTTHSQKLNPAVWSIDHTAGFSSQLLDLVMNEKYPQHSGVLLITLVKTLYNLWIYALSLWSPGFWIKVWLAHTFPPGKTVTWSFRQKTITGCIHRQFWIQNSILHLASIQCRSQIAVKVFRSQMFSSLYYSPLLMITTISSHDCPVTAPWKTTLQPLIGRKPLGTKWLKKKNKNKHPAPKHVGHTGKFCLYHNINSNKLNSQQLHYRFCSYQLASPGLFRVMK